MREDPAKPSRPEFAAIGRRKEDSSKSFISPARSRARWSPVRADNRNTAQSASKVNRMKVCALACAPGRAISRRSARTMRYSGTSLQSHRLVEEPGQP